MISEINMLSTAFKCCSISLLIFTSTSSTISSPEDFYSELKTAVLDDYLETAHQLLSQNRTDWLTEERGWEIASIAAEKGNLHIIEYIAERKLTILEMTNAENGNETIAYIAAKHGYPNITEYILGKVGRCAWLTTDARASLFHLAAEKGYLNIIWERLAVNYDDLPRIAKIGAENGHLDIACYAAIKKGDVYCKHFQHSIDTAIKKSRKRDPKTLELFGQLAEEWRKTSYCSEVVRMVSNHIDLLEYLAEKRCTLFLILPRYTNQDGAMEIAFEKNLVNQKFLECLERENGTIQGYIGAEYYKQTICHFAAKYGRLDVFRFVAQRSVSVLEQKDASDKTAVDIAVSHGRKDILLYVVEQKPSTIVTKPS